MKLNDTWRSIVRIAKIELNTMFYSPIAWLILVVFTVQAGMCYSGLINDLIHRQVLGEELTGITGKMFGEEIMWGVNIAKNFFTDIINYLYLYLPLMTMGLLSREYNSGSIKLLFSSPVKNSAIVLGKFGAMLIYGGVFIAVIVCYVLFSGCVIEHFDWGHAWVGVLGIFFLICIYSAIGLFMSSVTSYPVVAGIGTLALLAVLNYIGGVGQDIAFVRDITYWLALSSKTRDFVLGIIPSESVAYFVSLILFFLFMTLLRLEDKRTRRNRKLTIARYGVAVAVLIGASWISSRPSLKFYYDATATQSNTLSLESQEIVKQVDGPLKMTTYVNMLDNYVWTQVLPTQIKTDMKRFEQYTCFKPEIEMEYVYYWDEAGNQGLQETYPDLTNKERAELICQSNKLDFNSVLTPEQIKARIDLSPFGNHVVRHLERGNGKEAWLPIYWGHVMHPEEKEITAVFKHLAGQTFTVGFVEGHGGYSILNQNMEHYWWMTMNFFERRSLTGMGFEVLPLELTQHEIPERLDLLVIPGLKTPLSESEKRQIRDYIGRGGNLMVLTEAGRQQNSNVIIEQLGVRYSDEIAVCASKNPNIIAAELAIGAEPFYSAYLKTGWTEKIVAQRNVLNIDYSGVKQFRTTPVVVSPAKGVWLEKEIKDFAEDSVALNPAAGEKEGVYTFVLALEREVGDKNQRILVCGDPYWFNSGHDRLFKNQRVVNYQLFPIFMNWLSEDTFPVKVEKEKPMDNRIMLNSKDRKWNSWGMIGVFPGIFLLAGMVLMSRRKRG